MKSRIWVKDQKDSCQRQLCDFIFLTLPALLNSLEVHVQHSQQDLLLMKTIINNSMFSIILHVVLEILLFKYVYNHHNRACFHKITKTKNARIFYRLIWILLPESFTVMTQNHLSIKWLLIVWCSHHIYVYLTLRFVSCTGYSTVRR